MGDSIICFLKNNKSDCHLTRFNHNKSSKINDKPVIDFIIILLDLIKNDIQKIDNKHCHKN